MYDKTPDPGHAAIATAAAGAVILIMAWLGRRSERRIVRAVRHEDDRQTYAEGYIAAIRYLYGDRGDT